MSHNLFACLSDLVLFSYSPSLTAVTALLLFALRVQGLCSQELCVSFCFSCFPTRYQVPSNGFWSLSGSFEMEKMGCWMVGVKSNEAYILVVPHEIFCLHTAVAMAECVPNLIISLL